MLIVAVDDCGTGLSRPTSTTSILERAKGLLTDKSQFDDKLFSLFAVIFCGNISAIGKCLCGEFKISGKAGAGDKLLGETLVCGDNNVATGVIVVTRGGVTPDDNNDEDVDVIAVLVEVKFCGDT